MSDLYSAWANYGKERREEEAQKKLVMPTASALQRFGNIAPVPGTDINPRTNPAMSPPAPDMREFAPGTRLGQTESGMAAYKAEQDRMAAEAARSEQELQRQGISQYADLYEDTDPEFANFVRMGVNTGILKDKKDVIDVFSKYMESQRGKKETADKQAFESGESALDRESAQKRTETMAGAGITRANIGAEGKEDKSTFTQENQLRAQYNNISKNFTTIRDSYTRVKTSAQKPSAAGDLSMIFNYMKMLDPNSVVRESEYASAENARGIPETIRNTYNKVMDGKILSPKQRDDFLNRANELYSSAEAMQKQLKTQYGSIATSYGIDADRVTGGVVVGRPEASSDVEGDATSILDEIRQRRQAGVK